MSARRALSKRLRFQVFDRDGFTCVYCGRRPPAVTLEIDHVVPVIEGGGDEYENLVTSCFDCNRGKAGTPLGTTPKPRDLTRETAELEERAEQLHAYNAVLAAQRAHARCYLPWEGQLRNEIEILGVEAVKDAMQVARNKFTYLTANAPRYFGGVIRAKIQDAQG